MVTVTSVFVTGIGVVSAIGNTTHAFASALGRGQSAIRPRRVISSSDVEVAVAAAEPPSTTSTFARPDIRVRDLALPALKESLNAAGFASLSDVGERTCLIVATTVGGVDVLGDALTSGEIERGAMTRLHDWPAQALAEGLAQRHPNLAFSVTIASACAAGSQAIALGLKLLQAGEFDRAVVGGVDALSAYTTCGFKSLQALAPEIVRPFDKRRNGTALGEGAAFFVLEASRNDKVPEGALAEFLGAGESADAHHLTRPHPEGAGLRRAIELALRDGGVDRGDVEYVNAHGTGTRFNDASECIALAGVFGDALAGMPVSSIKAAIGHTLGAAGALELAATIACLRRGFLPPTLNFGVPDQDCPIDPVPETRATEAKLAMSLSAGFGGVNTALLVQTL